MPIRLLWSGGPCTDEERATVTVQRMADGAVLVLIDAPYYADPAPSSPAGPTWALWEHEVVELFLLGDHERYLELEVGPHGHYLVLLLDGRRKVTDKLLPLEVSVSHDGGRWAAQARIPASLLPPGELRGNAYAIHGAGTRRRYLAWTPVPGPHPDFHRLEHFTPVFGTQAQ